MGKKARENSDLDMTLSHMTRLSAGLCRIKPSS